MKFNGLIDKLEYNQLQGDMNTNISMIANDSRKVTEGGVFVAIKGFEQDGHKYIKQAVDAGAKAIVLEDDSYLSDIPENISVIQVKNGRKVLAYMATEYYNHPSSQFKLVGVTGTNGKTSTVFLINNVLESLGRKTGLIGTIQNKIDKKIIDTERTTPESVELKGLFSEMAKANVNDVVMEVSSHALDLYRVAYSQFDVAVFSNLTLDHLDYHKTMDNYRNAKAKLFAMAKKAVVNIDDEASEAMINAYTGNDLLTFSLKDKDATLFAYHLVNKLDGIHFDVDYAGDTYHVELQTPGEFSVYNGLATLGACLALGVSLPVAISALKENSQIKGRFQAVKSQKGYTAIVDYAHAPDGLENVLTAIQGFATKKIITVVGCGGDRDTSKRPIMGGIAARMSDITVITSDNPRTEDPELILDDVEKGVIPTGKTYFRLVDRYEGIRKGLSLAEEGDIVLIAGKGHEDYQIIGKTKHHFDDVEVVQEFMEENDK